MLNSSLLDNHNTVLVAVSGGSDSLALLYLIAEHHSELDIKVATVDHDLRPEAREEAEGVARHCRSLGLNHVILPVKRPPRSASVAREVRYSALSAYAETIGATAILLGHTMDDQAETLVMRALRMTDTSNTRGLAGMTASGLRDKQTLLRPLLGQDREALRNYLREKNICWVDDPSNDNNASERVRARYALCNAGRFPSVAALAKFACLCSRSNGWLNEVVTGFADERVHCTDAEVAIEAASSLPGPVFLELLARSIHVTGGRQYLPANSKLSEIVTAAQSGSKLTRTVGGCLVILRDNKVSITVEKERRPRASSPAKPAHNRSYLAHAGKAPLETTRTPD